MAEPVSTPSLASRPGPQPGHGSSVRKACDACHASKHRCDRPSDDSACLRCSKTGRQCIWPTTGAFPQVSPAAQATGPIQSHPPTPRTPASGQRSLESSCAHCRKSKTRCLRESGAKVCIRCAKTGRDCIVNEAGPRGRKPRGHQSDTVPGISLNSNSAAAVDTSTPFLEGLTSYASMDTGFNHNPAPVNNAAKQFDLAPPPLQAVVPASNPQLDYLTRLGNLQQLITADLELVKHCNAAEKCPESTLPPELGYNASFPIGSMLQNAQKLLEILDVFEPVPLAAPTPPTNGRGPSSTGKVQCDVPTMYALFACYIALVRVFRTNFSSIHDSMPFFFGLQRPLPQLFPGINLGGFSLEARLDLQVHLLIQAAEDMLSKLEVVFGIAEGVSAGKSVFKYDDSRILAGMLVKEAEETPPLHEPRGNCKPLKGILTDLKMIIQSEGAKR